MNFFCSKEIEIGIKCKTPCGRCGGMESAPVDDVVDARKVLHESLSYKNCDGLIEEGTRVEDAVLYAMNEFYKSRQPEVDALKEEVKKWSDIAFDRLNTINDNVTQNAVLNGIIGHFEEENAAFKKRVDELEGGNFKHLFELLALHGGKIVSTASLEPIWIEQARVSGRMYVDNSALGFVWEPDIKGFPETPEQVVEFEKWFPIQIPLPENLTFDNLKHRIKKSQIEAGENVVIKNLKNKGLI